MNSYSFKPKTNDSPKALSSADLFSSSSRIPMPSPMESGYMAWKKQNEKPKEVNMASFNDFPDLGTPSVAKEQKTGVFGHVSLADKLKQTIAAEEEEIKRRRLEDHDKEERWLRKNCVALPCKGLKATEKDPESPTIYHFKDDVYIPMPLFQPKTQEQYSYIRKIAVLDAIGANIPQDTIIEIPMDFVEENYDQETNNEEQLIS